MSGYSADWLEFEARDDKYTAVVDAVRERVHAFHASDSTAEGAFTFPLPDGANNRAALLRVIRMLYGEVFVTMYSYTLCSTEDNGIFFEFFDRRAGQRVKDHSFLFLRLKDELVLQIEKDICPRYGAGDDKRG